MYFRSIQKLRGGAALAVLLFHVSAYLVIIGKNKDTVFRYVSDHFGFDGVILFFVISGFIMAYLINNDSGMFFYRRLIRIYPAFLIAGVTVFISNGLLRSFGTPVYPNFLLSLTLFPLGDRVSYPLGIEWTLVYEIFFYIICAVINLFFRVLFPFFLITWLIMIYVAQHYYHTPSPVLPSVYNVFLSGYNIPFIFGGISYYMVKYLKDIKGIYILFGFVVAIAIYVIHFMFSDFTMKITLVGAGFATLIFAVSVRDLQNRALESKTVTERLGDYSYGMYLLHVPVIMFIYNMSMAMSGGVNTSVAVCALLLALSLGWYYGKFDVYLHRSLKRVLLKR